MNDDLSKEINAKVKRKKDLREEIASRGQNIEAFALTLINEMEDMIATTTNLSLLKELIPLYAKSFQSRVHTVDPYAVVDVQWTSDANGIPRINGILINWSKEYQDKNNCDSQLFVDMMSLLLK